ncbi:MAG: biotin synthase BioB [Gammaproteobacteria bacterium]|nr:biotin synthase BioB [Gammaproteobacteria bacterium]
MDIKTVSDIYTKPFLELLYDAHTVHRQHHPRNTIQMAKLLSIKTGACPEDCGYCSQSGHHKTELEKEKLMCTDDILAAAQKAKDEGATRFCMGAAWRSPPEKVMQKMAEVIKAVKDMGLETCMTLGMLSKEQAETLKAAGLDFYNHNIDTSPSYYDKVATTRTFADRINTVERVREAGIQVCCGGILGIGETREDRIEFIHTLANLNPPPESVPINKLMPVKGAPLGNSPEVEGLELIRTIATARILMPESKVRLSAGRTGMSDELQAMAFFAGANSIFVGDQLLTTPNPEQNDDNILFEKLGLYAEA